MQPFGLLVVPQIMIVPISMLICLVCLRWPASRPFGRGVLAGTLISAAVFVPICFAATT
jgi:hypothetical protein